MTPPLTTWASPSGQNWTVHRDAVPLMQPFFKRLHELYPGYKALGGYAHRPMRTLDGRNLGGLSSHASGFTVDIKAPDEVLRTLAGEFPHVRWGGNFKSHYDPVHFEFRPGAPAIARGGEPMRDRRWTDPLPIETDDVMLPPAARLGAAESGAPRRQPNIFENLYGRTMNPMFQGGLGMFLAAAQGGDLNEGLNQGMTRHRMMTQSMQEEQDRAAKEASRAAMERLFADPSRFGELPPGLLDIARATRDPTPIVQHLAARRNQGTDDMREFEFAKSQGFTGTFAEWIRSKRAASERLGNNVIYGTGPDGETVALQPSSTGRGLVRADLPPGVTISSGVDRVDLGTHFALISKRDGTLVGTLPKNVEGAAEAEVAGKARGEAKADLPRVESSTEALNTYIDSVLNDPNLDQMIGFQGYAPNVTPQARALQAKIDQLSGQAFLIAFQSLKGGGAITEVEGRKASEALSRIQEMVQSGQDYRQALRDFRAEVNRLADVARARASTGTRRLRFDPATGEWR